jgi:hypothetical protein
VEVCKRTAVPYVLQLERWRRSRLVVLLVTLYKNQGVTTQRNLVEKTNNMHYILDPTCFGSSLPLSGSFLDPSELLEIQIEWVVYHKMCGYVPECRGSNRTTTFRHTYIRTIYQLAPRGTIFIKFDVGGICQICRKYLSLFKIGQNHSHYTET